MTGVGYSKRALAKAIDRCMVVDQPRLRRRLQRLKGKSDRAWQDFLAAVEDSAERRRRRAEQLPRPSFPAELPVSEHRDEIARALSEHQVVVICGDTGSGKTTQLPKLCLELGRGVAGMIGHTQPRRIAARSLAARIAEELQGQVGQAVGYKVRFKDRVSADSHIKVMTDGILLAELQGDRHLNQYDTIIIDEAHERSLNIDFLLGYLKRLLPKRPDLKVIITSATIDPERFAQHFGDAPVIEVAGRTYPVEVRYRPLQGGVEARDRDLQQGVVDAVDELSRAGTGDILVFLSGEREIRETAEVLRKHHPPHTEILSLYARQSAQAQQRVFAPHGGRRIVLATNVAETSLTVPGIRYVVDTGYARISRYSHRSQVQRLPVEPIAQASARQRAGRCGRLGPGICIRLYSEADFEHRPAFTPPAIRRTNLAAVILQMQAAGLGEIEHFPFVEPPDKRLIKDGYRTLFELGGLDANRRLTALGRELAKLPVDPRLGRIILAARDHGSLHEGLVITAALAVQDPRERPWDAQEQADAAHQEFQDKHSDFLSLFNLWQAYHQAARHRSQNKLRAWCKERFVSYLRMREWHDTYVQLKVQVTGMGWRINREPANYAAVHRALLAGLLAHIGQRDEERRYTGTRGAKFQIFPGSALFKRSPRWIMAAELAETTRLYARTVATVEPAWIDQAAGHLVKRHYYDAHWEKRRGAVMAFEQASLYGLPLVTRRKVQYGPIDPSGAREIFIRQALVAGDFHTDAAFWAHNQALLVELRALEDKARRPDLIVDEATLYQFFDERIPAGIYDARSFERWRRQAEQLQPRLLYFDRETLLRQEPSWLTREQYPQRLTVGGMELALEYHFEPGHPADGVTAVVPLAGLNQLPGERLAWLVPGLLTEKLAALIKGLPKQLRRNFVPAPDFARACAEAMDPDDGDLLAAFSRHLGRMTGVTVPREAWPVDQVPEHLRMNIRVVDAQGKTLAMDRNLDRLQRQLGDAAADSFAGLSTEAWERDDIRAWDFGELPERVEWCQQGVRLAGYPALADEEGYVALRLLDAADKAAAAMPAGLRRLFRIQLGGDMRYLDKALPGLEAMCWHYASVGNCQDLKEDLVETVLDAVFLAEPWPRDRDAFEARLEAGRTELVATANALCDQVDKALAAYHAVTRRLTGSVSPAALKAVEDIKDQLAHLVYPGFVRHTPRRWLARYPCYLEAIARRLDKLVQDPARDRQAQAAIASHWQAYREQAERLCQKGSWDPELAHYRWMLEEYRVSLFAQELKTAVSVSDKRLREQWRRVA